MIGLPNGCNAAAVLEPLLKLSYVHVAPDASVYRESIFALAAAEHHSLKISLSAFGLHFSFQSIATQRYPRLAIRISGLRAQAPEYPPPAARNSTAFGLRIG
jgi:hypothetical protein